MLVPKCDMLPKPQHMEPPGDDASWERIHRSYLLCLGTCQTITIPDLTSFGAAGVRPEQRGSPSTLNMSHCMGDQAHLRTIAFLSRAPSNSSTQKILNKHLMKGKRAFEIVCEQVRKEPSLSSVVVVDHAFRAFGV